MCMYVYVCTNLTIQCTDLSHRVESTIWKGGFRLNQKPAPPLFLSLPLKPRPVPKFCSLRQCCGCIQWMKTEAISRTPWSVREIDLCYDTYLFWKSVKQILACTSAIFNVNYQSVCTVRLCSYPGREGGVRGRGVEGGGGGLLLNVSCFSFMQISPWTGVTQAEYIIKKKIN